MPRTEALLAIADDNQSGLTFYAVIIVCQLLLQATLLVHCRDDSQLYDCSSVA